MSRAAHAPLRPQVVHQLFFQCSSCLDEQAAVDGLVGHAHALVVGILSFQPPGNLLGRLVQHQFTRNDVVQLAVHGKQIVLRPQRCVPGLLVRIIGAIGRSATMARDFPTDRRRSPMKTTGNLTHRRTEAIPREMFSRSAKVSASRERQRANGGMPPRGSNTARIVL